MDGLRRRLALLFAVLIVSCLAAHSPAWAQADDGWSFILTPQVWVSHIEKNGFAAPIGLGRKAIGGNGTYPDSYPDQILFNQFRGTNSSPVDNVNPQWGLQLAAQRGLWTVAASFQYATFETRSDIIWDTILPGSRPNLQLPNPFGVVGVLGRVAQEFVDTTRIDVDFSASRFFPGVVARWLDLSLGGGLKVIYTTASREYRQLTPWAVLIALTPGQFPEFPPRDVRGTGLYAICKRDDCSDLSVRTRVKSTSWLYGPIMPMSAIFHLTNDTRWLLPLRVMPFIGAESRDDQDVVYRVAQNAYPNATAERDFRVKRLDGTTFAYGATVDATVRWLINDTISTYAGARVQYIEGHNTYLAYGPLFGMSIRFGGN